MPRALAVPIVVDVGLGSWKTARMVAPLARMRVIWDATDVEVASTAS
jgi:hypothetical protein